MTGPIEVTLARSVATVEISAAQLRRAAWDLKIDGWRLVILRVQDRVELLSRHGTNLTSNFPDVAAAALSQVRSGAVIDGEVTIVRDGVIEWDQLQHRMGSSRRAASHAATMPASYLAFDALAIDGADIRGLAWSKRRAALEKMALNWQPPLQLVPCTRDPAEAARWFSDYESVPGIEGLVAKGQTSSYQPGRRPWLRIKRYDTREAIVGAVIGPVKRPQAIVVGRYNEEGQLVIVGRSVALDARQAADLGSALRPTPSAEHPWPAQISGGFSGGFSGGPPVDLTHVEPTQVVEIAADPARLGGRHRHAVRYLRRRLDLGVDDVERFT